QENAKAHFIENGPSRARRPLRKHDWDSAVEAIQAGDVEMILVLVCEQNSIDGRKGIEIEDAWRIDSADHTPVTDVCGQEGIDEQSRRGRREQPALVSKKCRREHPCARRSSYHAEPRYRRHGPADRAVLGCAHTMQARSTLRRIATFAGAISRARVLGVD